MLTAHGVIPLPVYSRIKIDDFNPKIRYVGFVRKHGPCMHEPIWLIYRELVESATKITSIEYASGHYDKCWNLRDTYFDPVEEEGLSALPTKVT